MMRMSATKVSMHLGTGEGRMRTERVHGLGIIWQDEAQRFGDYSSGVWVTCSDTIGTDSRVPFIPFWEGRRQTEHATEWSTTIPCFLHSHSTIHFCSWIQPVAAVNEERLRQLKSNDARPEKAGGRMTTYCQDSFRLHAFSTGIPQTQDAASMANPEVTRCR
jgi:hypothetical protein